MNTKARRVIQVFSRYVNAGGEEYSVDRIRTLINNCHELTSCTFDNSTWLGKDAPNVLTQALMTIYNPQSARELASLIRRRRAEAIVLHNPYPIGSPSLYRTALKLDVPIIQYIHNFRPFSVGGTLWARGRLCTQSLQKRYLTEVRLAAWQSSVTKSAILATALKGLHAFGWLRAVKVWIAVSEFMRQTFIDAGVDASEIHTLLHFWDMNTGTNEVFPDGGYYLFLGRLVEEKGVGVLIEAWNQLCNEIGTRAPELWIAGDGPLRPSVERASHEHPSIRYLGFVEGEKKAALISNCRAMLAPSLWWEPLGLVAYEAYDYKKPILASAAGGLTETVSHGRTGFLHQPGDARELASQIVSCEKLRPSQRALMGRRGRAWLESNADRERWNTRFNEILDDVIEARRVSRCDVPKAHVFP